MPNEPLVFADETSERSEDAIIAYTWDKFLHTGDAKWPLRLPMTKAAVRAMEATSGFLASKAGGKIFVDRYVVANACAFFSPPNRKRPTLPRKTLDYVAKALPMLASDNSPSKSLR